MAAPGIRPRLVIADAQGNIYDDPELQMVCRKGYEFSLPKPDELIPLPEGSELFLLPGRNAIGMNPENGQLETTEELAVAACRVVVVGAEEVFRHIHPLDPDLAVLNHAVSVGQRGFALPY